MTSRSDADRAETYLRSRDALAGLTERWERAVSDAVAEGAAEVRRVEVQDRAIRDRLANAAERLEHLERDLALLARRADVRDVEPGPAVHLQNVDAAVDLVRGLAADLDSARTSWEWVERARARPALPATQTAPAVSPTVPEPLPEPAAHEGASRGHRMLLVVVGGALVLAFIVLVVVLKGL